MTNEIPPLTVATNLGPHVVQPAAQAGDLALHLRIGTDATWTITHRPSGWAIIDLLEPRRTAEKVLLELAVLDWSGVEKLTWLDRDTPIVKAVNHVFAHYKTLQKEEMFDFMEQQRRRDREAPRRRSAPMDKYK